MVIGLKMQAEHERLRADYSLDGVVVRCEEAEMPRDYLRRFCDRISYIPKALNRVSRAGLTYVEALTVLTIISLLTALLLGAAYKARETLKGAITTDHLKEVIIAVEQYRVDNHTEYPSGEDITELATKLGIKQDSEVLKDGWKRDLGYIHHDSYKRFTAIRRACEIYVNSGTYQLDSTGPDGLRGEYVGDKKNDDNLCADPERLTVGRFRSLVLE